VWDHGKVPLWPNCECNLITNRRPRCTIHLGSNSMSKHTLSSAPLPPAKRLRTSAGLSDSFLGRSRSSSLDDTLSERAGYLYLFLSLLGRSMHCTSYEQNWCRLAADNELWRKLYLKVYGRSRLRGASGFLTRPDGKEMKPLPGGEEPTVFRDWKWMSASARTGGEVRIIYRIWLQAALYNRVLLGRVRS